MRPFADMAMELFGLANAGISGMLTNEWDRIDDFEYLDKDRLKQTREELLNRWDNLTKRIDEICPQITSQRFFEVDKA